jgi:hypothetical protein
MTRKLYLPGLALGLTATTAALGTAPAGAATSGDTTLNVTLTSVGGLEISVPTSATLTGTVGASTVQGALGTVTVTDNRAQLLGGWSAAVSATDLSAGPDASIPAANILYTPGLVTGVGAGTPTSLSNTPKAVVTAASIVGVNTGSWSPTLVVTLPGAATGKGATGAGTVAATYTGTITHSVS